jgi:hypothetical protein
LWEEKRKKVMTLTNSRQHHQHCHCRKGQDIPEKALLEKQNLVAGIPGLGEEVLDCFLKDAEEIRAEPEVLTPPHTKISRQSRIMSGWIAMSEGTHPRDNPSQHHIAFLILCFGVTLGPRDASF